MSGPTIAQEDRQVVRILAFAAREFDRAHDILVADDEPGEREVAPAARADADADGQHRRKKGPVRRLLGVAGGVARAAGRVVTGSVHPRHPGWEEASVDERVEWWVDRFGTAAAALAAVPGLGGRIGRLTSVGDVAGASAQVLVVNAVAVEMGITDVGHRVAVAGRIVLGRELDAGAVREELNAPDSEPDDDAPGDAPQERQGPLAHVGRSAALVWRVATRIRSLRSDLGERPQGGLVSRAISNLPAVGAIGAFLSERKGISTAAERAKSAFAG